MSKRKRNFLWRFQEGSRK